MFLFLILAIQDIIQGKDLNVNMLAAEINEFIKH